MSQLSPGFHGRPRSTGVALPPGQYLTEDFPVLSAGPTPRVPLDTWEFVIVTETGVRHRWSWAELLALPQVEEVETAADYVLAHSYGGYTTNLPLEDLLDGRAIIGHTYDGEPLTPAHGGPARLLVPHLYLWKSAKWVRGLEMMIEDVPGFWESAGYHDYGDPWREQRYQGD
jgi:DMSO/TMAO reductase YedYZ molybdopterin-dependent catalytic subunit